MVLWAPHVRSTLRVWLTAFLDTSHSYNLGLSDIDNGEIKSSPSPRHSDTAQRKLLAKIDLRVVPGVCVLFFLAFLDRYRLSIVRKLEE